MRQEIILQPLGLIDPDRVGVNEYFLFEIKYEMFSDRKVFIYKKMTTWLY
ncbi:hypothetical protein [Cellvibrio sp. QJXJ]|nr:hypothetical protein [Cellvibrio sp. QJXJ]UUA74686.1 hypothetical protein NNX04_09640 [Cellvibrio sp. QJXJ]